MKKYEKPSIVCLEMSSIEDLSAFSKFDNFEGSFTELDGGMNSYMWTSGDKFDA